MCLDVYVCILMSIQVLSEDRDDEFPFSRGYSWLSASHVGAGNKIWLLLKAAVLFTLQPKAWLLLKPRQGKVNYN